jgi:hypothetical protein
LTELGYIHQAVAVWSQNNFVLLENIVGTWTKNVSTPRLTT